MLNSSDAAERQPFQTTRAGPILPPSGASSTPPDADAGAVDNSAGAPERCRPMDGHTRNLPPPANDRQRGPSSSVLLSQETAGMLIRQADVRSGSRICCATEDSQSSRRRPPGWCIAAALERDCSSTPTPCGPYCVFSQAKRAAAGGARGAQARTASGAPAIQAPACVARSPAAVAQEEPLASTALALAALQGVASASDVVGGVAVLDDSRSSASWSRRHAYFACASDTIAITRWRAAGEDVAPMHPRARGGARADVQLAKLGLLASRVPSPAFVSARVCAATPLAWPVVSGSGQTRC